MGGGIDLPISLADGVEGGVEVQSLLSEVSASRRPSPASHARKAPLRHLNPNDNGRFLSTLDDLGCPLDTVT